MSTSKLSERLFFPGIDLVVREFEAEPVLPQQSEISPAEAPTRSLLEELYPGDDLDAEIVKSLKPALADPSLLRPAVLQSTLSQMPGSLLQLAMAQPRVARAVGPASQLISGELARRNWLWELKMAMYQV
jgi:hypothetical protein